MDLKILRNFVEIVDSGSLTAASKKLFIAQPALSNQLKALEKELGVLLLERNSRHQKLTDAGFVFYERAKSILLLQKNAAKEVQDIAKGDAGCLRLACIPSGEIALLNKILPTFVRRFPKITYEIYEEESGAILHRLESGAVDAGIVTAPCDLTKDMEALELSDGSLGIAYDPLSFPEAENMSQILPQMLSKLPLLLIRRYRDLFSEYCKQRGVLPNIRAHHSQLLPNLKWAEQGLGCAIVPENILSHFSDKLHFKPLQGEVILTRRAIVTMKNGYRSRIVNNFLSLCRELL